MRHFLQIFIQAPGTYLCRSLYHQGGAAFSPIFGPEQRVALTAIENEAAQNSDAIQLRHALRGSILRTELYATDGSPIAERPYPVTEAQFDVREIDPPA